MFLLKGTVRSYDAGTGAAEVEIVGSHGAYITVPVATHLDSRSVYAGLRCAVLCFDPNDQSDGVLVATYDELPLMGAGSVDHGALDGLGDDDHTQYLNTTRHTAIGNGSPHHAPVTLGTFENATLNGQELNYTLPDHAHTDEGGEGGVLTDYPGVVAYATDYVASEDTASTSYEDIAGLSISLTIDRPCVIFLLLTATDNNGDSGYVIITDSSDTQIGPTGLLAGPSGAYMATAVPGVVAKTAGTYGFKGRCKAISGTLSMVYITLVGFAFPT